MKKIINKCLSLSIAACMTLSILPVTSFAASSNNFKNAAAIPLGGVSVPEHDYTRANKLPMTGYFEKTFTMTDGSMRSAKIYISSDAPVRSYFTVISVPDEVDTEEFLEKSGWKDIVDKNHECLFVLEPGDKGWGTAAGEKEYVNAAMNFYANPVDPLASAPNNKYFSIYGENYLVGYGNGAPALEAWAAANPLKVISQAYVDSKGLEAEYFEQFEKIEFGGTNGNYVEIAFPDGFDKITYDEVVLPTWYINPDENAISDSLSYWKGANDCAATPVSDGKLGDVFNQKDDSDRWMTDYSGPISKVAVLNKKSSVNDTNFTKKIYDFLTYYTRYENAVAYGNTLAVRADYHKLGIEIKNMVVNGYVREYMVYVPETAKKLWGDKAPVLMVFPGDSQTDKVFLDATQWWQVAQEKGFILTIVCEQYNNSSVAVSHKDSEVFCKQLKEEIINNYDVDPARIYAAGQSAGSMLSQAFAMARPEFFAAVASTSAAPTISGNSAAILNEDPMLLSNKMIPVYLGYGAGDLSMIAGDLWDGINNQLDSWAAYHLGINGFDLGNGTDNMINDGNHDRYKIWTWSKEIGTEDVPLVKLHQNLYRSHNCMSEEMPMLWDFLEHYSYEVDENNNVTRYYSESGFKNKGDMIEIYSDNNSIAAMDFNSYTTTLAIDYNQATQLPLTGYFTKAIGTERSVKVYIPENAPIRAKFTVIAVPEGVNTYSFLKNEGWINRADVNGECIFALEPGVNGWGTQAEENDYIINAMRFLTSGTNDNKVSVFSNYGAFYLVGYNKGCAPLESWSANNPIYVNSQVYINGTSVGKEYLDTVGAKKYNGKNTGGYDPGQDDDDFMETLKSLGYDGTFMSQNEVPVPTWFIGYENDSYSITYWKNANDVVSTPDGDVYHQDINSDAWQTQYANESILRNNPNAEYGMSQVKVSKSANLKAEDIFKFHSEYIRYTTTFAYSNHLEYRLDYGKMLVDLQKKASSASITSEVYDMPDGKTGSYDSYAQADIKVKAYDGKTGTVISGIVALSDYNNDGKKDPRDYIAYVPDSAKEIWGEQGAPVVLVHPGMTQTASVFMDASMWWQVANDEGCVFIIVGEAYSSATGVSYKSDSTEFAYMLESILSSKISNYTKLDYTRIYGSGHSLGCRTIQDLSMSNPDLIAAVSSTSFPPSTADRSGEMMPNYFIHGQSDLPFELPDLWGNTGLQDWAGYFFTVNGLNTDINSYSSSDTSGRFHTYVWNNIQNIPMVKYGYTLAREHNCIPQEFAMGWDFLEHYSFVKDDNGHVIARYYSPSGFKDEDMIKIIIEE